MKEFAFVGSHAEDITGGRTLTPGEVVKLDEEDPHNSRMINEGRLIPTSEKKKPIKKEGDS